MTKPATIDSLAADVLLAYVPMVTPEGDGVEIKLVDDQWCVDGGDKFAKADRSSAEAQAKQFAQEKWGV